MRIRYILLLTATLSGFLLLPSCGGKGSSSGNSTNPPTAIAPTIAASGQPQNQTVTAGQTATFTVTATGTAPLGYQWKKDSVAINSATGASYTTPATTATDSGSTFTVTVSNSAGNITSSEAILTVNPVSAGDTTAPSVPENLSGTPLSVTGIALIWTPSTDNVAVSGYRVYRGGTQIADIAATTHSDKGLAPATSYDYAVTAYDAAGNQSGQSTKATVTTPAAITTAPPCNIKITYPSTTSVLVTWEPDPQDANIKHYEISYNGDTTYTTTSTEYIFSGLTPGTSKSLRFRSVHNNDSVSNWTGYYGFLIPSTLQRRTLYVDQTLAAAVTDGSYDVSASDALDAGNAYPSLKAALVAMNGGDIVVLRGGTYKEGHVRIDDRKDGRSDRWSVLMAYPGEWVTIDGENGGGTGGIDGIKVGSNQNSYCTLGMTGGDATTNAFSYWRFERLEITGGSNVERSQASGFCGHAGPFWFRYCYIHDNTAANSDNNPGGLTGHTWQDSIVEYCRFENNGCLTSAHHNGAHMNIFSDYKPDTTAQYGFYETREPAVKRNTYRYNIFDGPTAVAIKYKQCQLLTGRNPLDGHGYNDTCLNLGDNIHHNIFRGTTNYAIDARQDFIQIHHNIFDGCQTALVVSEADTRLIYKAVVYNNTVQASGKTGLLWNHPTSTYDFPSAEADLHGYAYNNILDTCGSTWNAEDLTAWCPAVNTVATFNHFSIDRNYFYRPVKTGSDGDGTLALMIGNGDAARMTTEQYQSTHPSIEQWLSDYSVSNLLYDETAGAAKYTTRPTHVLTSGRTIGNAGLAGSHPYLTGVTFPAYVGATNPDDHVWVAGVLGLTSLDNQKNGTSDDPAWIE